MNLEKKKTSKLKLTSKIKSTLKIKTTLKMKTTPIMKTFSSIYDQSIYDLLQFKVYITIQSLYYTS